MKEIYQINQALSASVYKAMSLFGTGCRKPFMGVWRKLTRDILERLSIWGVMNSQEGIRFLEMMEPLAVQLTIEKAIILNWHTRGISKHFNKPFESSQVADAAPFLYCDSNTVLLTFTFMSSKIIKSDLGIILKALYKVCCNKDYKSDVNLYELFINDSENKIRFKIEKNPNYDRAIHFQLNKQIIDLNKLEIPMKLSELARAVSAQTPKNNYIAPSDCEKLIQQLAETSFCPNHGTGRNGYLVGMVYDDLKKHRVTKMPKIVLRLTEIPTQVHTFANEIYKTLYLDILKVIPHLDPFSYKTFAMGNILLDMLEVMKNPNYRKSELIVLLYIFRNEIPQLFEQEKEKIQISEGLTDQEKRNRLAQIENNPIQLVNQILTDNFLKRKVGAGNREASVRIFSSIPQVKLDEKTPDEDFFDFVNSQISFIHFHIILLAMDMKYIAERNIPEMNVWKRPILESTDGGYFFFASENAIPMLNNQNGGQQISIVQIKRDSVSFSPMAIPLFEKEIIVDAFLDSVMCDTLEPGKRLLGWPHAQDSSMMQTIQLTKEMIQEKIKEIDGSNMKPGYISRMEGLVYKRREYIEHSVKTFLYGVEAGPIKDMKVKKCIDVIRNLDEWAAMEQHLLIGRKFTDILYTPKYIKEHTQSAKGRSNYPDDIIAEKAVQKKMHWDPNAASEKRVKYF
jgi:hypothetical protein